MVPRVLCGYGREEHKKIKEYIKHQLDEDKALDQLTLKEFVDPFRGGK